MARADLDAIQAKLKLAIQNHQMLVVKMKADHQQNATMKSKLHELQAEIMSLSEKQKLIVQNLRKELVQKQTSQSPSPSPPVTHTQMVKCSPHIHSQAVLLPTTLPQTFSVTVPTAHVKTQPGLTVPVTVNSPSCQPTDLSVTLGTGKQIISGQNSVPIKPALKAIAPRGSSPPIRVPQYPISTSKPSIFQGSKSSILVTSKHMPPPDSAPHRRTGLESDIRDYRDLKKSVERKQVSPEEKEKMEFMASLDLVTPDTLKELQCKRTERKRRSTANPQFSYNFEPERKRVSHYLLNPLPPGVKRPRGRPPKHGPSPNNSRPTTPDSPNNLNCYKNGIIRNGSCESDVHDDFCAVCGKGGQLLLCNTCQLVYHLECLNPPLAAVPTGNWSCPKCQANSKTWAGAGTLALVHSYIATKAAKEEEKRKLQKKTTDLATEKSQLESRSKQLNESFNQQVQKNQQLIEATHKTQQSIENLKNFIKEVKMS